MMKRLLAALVLTLLAAGCDLTFTPPNPTLPADPIEVTVTPIENTPAPPTNTFLPSTASLTPSSTEPPRLALPTQTPFPGTPTETFTPTPTEGPYEYTIQTGDSLYYIIQLSPWRYDNFNVLNEILRLNPQIINVDRLPPAGSVILIPRPTPTPTSAGYELTVAARPAALQTIQPTGEAVVTEVTVREGNTIVGIAQEYNTTLAVLDRLNPELAFISCDFSNPSGGPDCNVPLVVGQTVKVPAPTPTPTLSPTFSGSETPLPTGTYVPPQLVFPPNGVALTSGSLQLQWVSAGVLRPGEVYLIQIEDQTTGATFLDVTRATSYPLPRSLVPTDDQAHTMRWRVSIATTDANGEYALVGGEAMWRVFQWRGR
ncbi:MAG: LysM peptidoglycan-binding domain-containing protein [Chloroflexota bacterium]|nr:LysM peptidoglycan-binding domain-containing protein [Chloroflexota bacterium]